MWSKSGKLPCPDRQGHCDRGSPNGYRTGRSWQRDRLRQAAFLVALVLGWPGCVSSPAEVMTTGKSGRVSSQLISVHDAYTASRQTGAAFPPSGVAARIVDDRVVIDATAEDDVERLRADLVGLGMQRASAFGRVVSGELPIEAIPSLARLDSLRFAAPASSIMRGRTAPPRYRE